MKKTGAAGKVGRPKKSPLIPVEKFLGEVNQPAYGGTVEWTYTETKNFHMIMKTFKSCGVENIHFHFLQNEIIIKGITNQHSKSEKASRLLKLSIDPKKTYRYYIRSPQKFKIPMTEWPVPLDDADEACNEFTIIYRGGDDLMIEIKNVSIVCTICGDIKIDKIEGDELESYDKLVSANIRNHKAKISNIKSENLKKLLGKSARKTCQNADFRIHPGSSLCEIDFQLSNERHQIIKFDINKIDAKNKNQFHITTTLHDVIYSIKFPNIEIHKFLLHIKTDKMEIYFADNCVIARVINDETNSIFTYYIPV